MNPLSWNCRGIKNPWSVRALHNLVQRYNPKIVFLMETKVGVQKMIRVQSRIGLQNGIIIPSEGRSGRLALLWERELDVELKSYTRNHIDAIVTDSKLSLKWRIMGFLWKPRHKP